MLTSRQKKVLLAVIRDYIRSGSPVGSKALANQLPFQVSSATVRNEMAYLEGKGLIKKTHSSSGRLPSINGYRYYIDHLISPNPVTQTDQAIIRHALNGRFHKIDEIVKQSANILSNLTHYTALTLRPERSQRRKLSGFRLVPLGNEEVMAILVTNNGEIESQVFHIPDNVSGDQLEMVVRLINDRLKGEAISTVLRQLKFQIPAEVAKYIHTPEGFLDTFDDVLNKAARDRFYVGGELNLLNYTNSSDIGYLKPLYSLLNRTDNVSNFIGSPDQPISVKIGSEISNDLLKHYSVITGTYNVGKYGKGLIAVLGPTRMPYSKVIGIVSAFRKDLAKRLLGYFRNYGQ